MTYGHAHITDRDRFTGPPWRWPEEAKRKIVEETFKPGASVAIVTRRYELNANVVFAWRRLYRAGGTGEEVTDSGAQLIPVKVIAPDPGRKRIQKRSRAAVVQTEGIEVLLAGGTQCVSAELWRGEALREIIAAVCAR